MCSNCSNKAIRNVNETFLVLISFSKDGQIDSELDIDEKHCICLDFHAPPAP